MRCASPPDSVEETVERQILEADFVEETQAFLKFNQKLFRDGSLLGRERQLSEEACRLFDRHAADLANILAIDLYLPRFHAQAGAVASGAQRVSAIAAEKDADVQLVFLALQVA